MTQKHKECPKPNVDYSANNKNIVDIFRIKMDKQYISTQLLM